MLRFTDALALIDPAPGWDGLATELRTTITRQTSKTPQPGGRSSETPVAFNIRASDAAAKLLRVLRYWTSVLAPDAPTADRGLAGMLAPNIRGYAHWIRRNLNVVRTNEAGPDIIGDIVRAIQDAVAAVDAAAGKLYAGRCEVCAADLHIYAGQDDAVCRGCDTVNGDRTAWRDTRHNAATDQLIEQHLILKALPVVDGSQITKQRLNNWLRRGKLLPAYRVWLSREPDLRPVVYRISDIQALAQRKAVA